MADATRRTTGRRPPDRAGLDSAGPSLAKREARLAYALMAPGVLLVLLLVLLPILWNLTLSFRDLRLIELRNFNPLAFELNFDNYADVIGGRNFFELLRTTLLYALISTTLSLLLGLWAAVTLTKAFPGRFLVRGLILFPYVVPVVAAAFLWRTALNPQLGIANAWLESTLGASNVNFLTARAFEVNVFGLSFGFPAAFTMVVLFEVWRSFPFAFLFILARLQALPADIDEAAMVDGATPLQSFLYVTLPQLRPVFAVLFLLRFIWTFNAFDEIFLLTGGAAGTQVVSLEIFEQLFGRSDVGAAAALSIVLALILAVALFIYFRFLYREEVA